MLRIFPLLLVACSPPTPGDLPMPMFQPDAGLYDAPWPDDFRTRADGTLELAELPGPPQVGLIDDYIAFGEQQVGFGNNSAIFLRLNSPADRSRLPSPAESMAEGSSIILVDVDPQSPYLGERFPIRWHESDQVTAYQPEGLLTIAPIAGFPLRPATRYALLLTTDGFAPNPQFQRVFDPGHARNGVWAEVEDLLPLFGLHPDEIAVGTVFTTFDPIEEMGRIARFVQTRLAPPDLDQTLEHLRTYEKQVAFRTHYPSPVFTHGERPFQSTGGEFRFDASGDPLIASWDDMRLSVCTPIDYIHAPEGGWPVVIYQHGTGGYYRNFCDSNRDLEVGRVMAQTGFIGLGIDQPLHGPRAGDGSTGSDLLNYNVLNPSSATTNFRQGAADALYLARALSRKQVRFTTPEGAEIALDPDRITFMGHSQGGQTGSIAAPFWAGDVQATLLSGAGGVLGITIVERKDPLDFAQLVGSLAQLGEDEPVYELHPVVQLVQMLIERTDMVNYAPYWYSQPLDWPGHVPSSVLMTSGTKDAATPYRTAIALAAAGRVPALYPRASSAQALDLRHLADSPSFTADNALSFDGPITAGFSQWTDGTHFVVFDEPAAAGMYSRYLWSASVGSPIITLDPEQDEL